MARVVVVGGGIIGLAVAYELRRRGHAVRVLEQQSPGWGSSEHNAGLIVPSKAAPLPSPEVTAHLPQYLLRADSPLYIRPTALPALAGWLWSFWRHSKQTHYERGSAALRALGGYTLPFLDAAVADGVRFEMHSRGVYLVFRDPRKFTAAAQAVRGHEDVQVIAGPDLSDLEPGLRPGLAGALWYHKDRHVRPSTVVGGLAARFAEIGGQLEVGVEVLTFGRKGRRVHQVRTGQGAVEADVVVLAAGAWTPRLARQLTAARLPIVAGKGYSITVPSPPVALRAPLYLEQSKVIGTPFADGSLRLAGTLEFSGLNKAVDARRVAAIARQAADYLRNWSAGQDGWSQWVGVRPMTPDGLPVIGRLPGCDNVYVAAGHGTYGFTLAPGTAVVLGDLIDGAEAGIDVAPFSPGRFGGAR